MADEKPYNISIEVKAQLEEIQKLLDELRSISAEMSKINGQTFSAVSMSAAELSKTGKDLAKALVSQRIASEEFNKMLGKTGSGLENAKEKTKKFMAWQHVSKDKCSSLVSVVITYKESNEPQRYVKIKGLLPDQFYTIEGENGVYSGRALMKAGIPLPDIGEYESIQYHITAV